MYLSKMTVWTKTFMGTCVALLFIRGRRQKEAKYPSMDGWMDGWMDG